ncbi:hypothetical protein ACF0H5_012155 [Mactra antiquata]
MSVSKVNQHTVFVYGTLKKGQPNEYFMKEVIPGNEYIGEAKTAKNYPLVIAGIWNLPMLINKEGKGKNVHGELYRVNDEHLEHLDQFEGHPEFYERKEIHVTSLDDSKMRGSNIKCWAYFIKDDSKNEIKSTYLDKYDSNANHGLPYDNTENDEHPDKV